MLCLKAEALDEDHHPQGPNNNRTNGNGNCNGGNDGGFILPINWVSSINRCLQWKSDKVWSKYFHFLSRFIQAFSEYLVSPASPYRPLVNFLTSFSDSSIATSLVRSPLGGGAYDPYGIFGKVNWTCGIGTYSTVVEVSWLSVGKKKTWICYYSSKTIQIACWAIGQSGSISMELQRGAGILD